MDAHPSVNNNKHQVSIIAFVILNSGMQWQAILALINSQGAFLKSIIEFALFKM